MKPVKSKFDFYEKVKIVSSDPNLRKGAGEISAVVGKAEEVGNISYAVFVYRDERCWSTQEEDLESIGEFDQHESFFSGERIRARVDETGRGYIVSDEESQNQ